MRLGYVKLQETIAIEASPKVGRKVSPQIHIQDLKR